MKYLKADDAGNVIAIINSNVFNVAPEGYLAFDTIEDDLVLINLRYVKNGELKVRVEQPTPNHVWDLTNENWVLDLSMLRTSKSRVIDLACKTAIVSGFTSAALGETYTYPSKTTDQQNLAASYMASFDPENAADWSTPFWCSDASGQWSFRLHTAAQIREVGRDAKSAVLGFQFKNEQLQAEIVAATTAEQLEAINW